MEGTFVPGGGLYIEIPCWWRGGGGFMNPAYSICKYAKQVTMEFIFGSVNWACFILALSQKLAKQKFVFICDASKYIMDNRNFTV